ncbi:helix-turn-helix transcriptional regulator [Zavarzinia aquatilis]|nr:WYL domain-containing protein [Zavarzinia aquatilis]
MRQEKVAKVLDLALALRASHAGLTLDDIGARLGVSERTAHRLRDAVAQVFPALDFRLGDDGRKYWYLPPQTVDRLVDVSADDLSLLASAAGMMAAQGNDDGAGRLRRLASRIAALIPPKLAMRLEPDVEALMEAEGIAHRPGPRPIVSGDVLSTIRQAIKASRRLSVSYRARRGVGPRQRRTVEPYGLLLGARTYLVGHDVGQDKGPFLRLFAVSGIEQASLEDMPFVRDPAVSMAGFVAQSFGVFHEDPVDVVWRFRGDAARDAAAFAFHPAQTVTTAPDGSVTVRFRAGGLLEMCWHLFTWGDSVEIVEPDCLRARYEELLRLTLRRLQGA